MFPSLDEYSDLSVSFFIHWVNNNEALAGTVQEGSVLGGIYKSLYLDLFDLFSGGNSSET